jgi:hypothetical protein
MIWHGIKDWWGSSASNADKILGQGAGERMGYSGFIPKTKGEAFVAFIGAGIQDYNQYGTYYSSFGGMFGKMGVSEPEIISGPQQPKVGKTIVAGDTKQNVIAQDEVSISTNKQVAAHNGNTEAAKSNIENTTLENAKSNNYRETLFKAYPDLKGKVVIHHAVEQQILKRYPGLFSENEINSLENLRGIPLDKNPDLHLSQIRKDWNYFYKNNTKPTKQDILKHASELDKKYGEQFNPSKN